MLPADFNVMRWCKYAGSKRTSEGLRFCPWQDTRLCWECAKPGPSFPARSVCCLLGALDSQGLPLSPASSSCLHVWVPASPPSWNSFPWSMVLNIFLSLNNLVKVTKLKHTYCWAPTPRGSDSVGLGGAWECAFLTSAHGMLMPLVWGPHFGNHCWTLGLNKYLNSLNSYCLTRLLFPS